MNKKELVAFLIENFTDEDGNLDLDGLDFSNFNGNVLIRGMKVKRNLHQNRQKVNGYLYQNSQKVDGNLYQDHQTVEGTLWQNIQKVNGNLIQRNQIVKGVTYQDKLESERN